MLSRILRSIFIALLFLFTLGGSQLFAQDIPSPVGYVNDFAGVMSDSARQELETTLTTLEKETGAEVAVVTLDSIGEYSIEEYSVKLFEKWGIGKKDQDNGVLLIVSLEHSDIRIEVGYGLESIITDGRAGRILDNEVIPSLQEDNFDTGLKQGVTAIEGYIREGTPPSIVEENPVQNILDNFRLPLPLIFGLGIVTIYMLGFMARTRSIWLGGIWGIILGLVLGFGFGGLFWMVALPVGLGVMGTLMDIILSASYRGRSSRGMSTGWFPSGGGFRGPWGGGGGGGFGGFGGGHSGGGGASRHF